VSAFLRIVKRPNPGERERSDQPGSSVRKARRFLKPIWGNSWDFRGKGGPKQRPLEEQRPGLTDLHVEEHPDREAGESQGEPIAVNRKRDDGGTEEADAKTAH
jgi:hypothetical protein